MVNIEKEYGLGPPGVGPPEKVGEQITSTVTSTLGYIVLLLVHVSLDLSLLVILLLILVNPVILRSWQTDLVIAGLALIDILISKKL